MTGFTTIPGKTYDMTGQVITSPVTLTDGITWIGGRFSGTGAAFNGKGINISIDGVLCDPTIDYMIDGNPKPFVTYDGINDNTFLFKNLKIANWKIFGKTILYNGTYEGPKTFHNVNFGMVIGPGVKTYDINSGNTLVTGHSIYKFKWNGWQLIGDTKTGLVDNGIVQINSGNGQGWDCYRNGKQDGYWFRCWGVALGDDPDQAVQMMNCVDANTVVYGTMDFRLDPGLLQSNGPIKLKGVNGYFLNNNSAYKEDVNNGYVTSAVVLGQLVDDLGQMFTMNIINNIAVAAHVSSMANNSSLFKDNTSGKALTRIAGNIDIPPGQPVPVGTLDPKMYSLIPGIGAQPPAGKQRSVLYCTYDGKKFTYYYDDGSVQ